MPTIASEFVDREIFGLVRDVAAARGVKAYVIGGYVRDCLLGKPCSDIDIVVEGSGLDFAGEVGRRTGRKVSYFKNFGTAMLRYRGDEVEFVGARRESYSRDSRKPIVEDGTLEEAWGCGTAAVVSPIGELFYKGKKYSVCDGKIGEVTQHLYDTLTGIQWGRIEDTFGWTYPLD